VAINIGDAVLKLVGDSTQLNQSLDQANSRIEQSMQKMQSAFRMGGMAMTALGAGGLKLVGSAREMNAQLGQTAITMGVSTKEMRDLALATTNVTFPLKEVIGSFDLLSKAGIENTEVMRKTATAFDTLGDATGYGASQVTDIMIPAMKTFGLSADEIASKIDIMTFMSKKSTMTLDDFATMVGYTTPQLVEQGLTIEELTAALILMEREGYAPGRVMTREFMKATTKAQKEQISLTEALGYTKEEVAALTGEMEGVVGITQEYADEANKQYGIMAKLKQKWEEITLSLGSFLTPLEPVLALMTAMGPAMMFLSTSMGIATVKMVAHTAAMVAFKAAQLGSIVVTKIATAVQWAWNVALTANPIGAIIMLITGLVAAGILLYKNWDKVVAKFKEGWEIFQAGWKFLKEKFLVIIEKFAGWIKFLSDKFSGLKQVILDFIKNAIEWLYDKMMMLIKPFKWMYEWIKKVIRGSGLVELQDELKKTGSDLDIFGGKLKGQLSPLEMIKDAIDGVTSSANDMRSEMQKMQQAPIGVAGELPAGMEEYIGAGAALSGKEAWRRAMNLSAHMEAQALARISGYLEMYEKGTAWAQATPVSKGGLLPDIQVHVDMNVDGTKLAEAVGEPLVDSIRLKTGVRNG